MYIGKRRAEVDEKKRLEDQRQKVIAFKKVFGTTEGRDVLTDLINKFHVFNPLPELPSEFERGRAEGKRDAVLYILGDTHRSMDDLDKILKGEFGT